MYFSLFYKIFGFIKTGRLSFHWWATRYIFLGKDNSSSYKNHIINTGSIFSHFKAGYKSLGLQTLLGKWHRPGLTYRLYTYLNLFCFLFFLNGLYSAHFILLYFNDIDCLYFFFVFFFLVFLFYFILFSFSCLSVVLKSVVLNLDRYYKPVCNIIVGDSRRSSRRMEQ